MTLSLRDASAVLRPLLALSFGLGPLLAAAGCVDASGGAGPVQGAAGSETSLGGGSNGAGGTSATNGAQGPTASGGSGVPLAACACGADCNCDSGYVLRDGACVLEVPTAAATLFVSPSGSDRNEGRSASAPMASITSALKKAQPGDVVQLQAGATFHEAVVSPFQRGGSQGKPITVTSDPSNRATIVVGAGKDAIRVFDSSFLVIENLVLVGPGRDSGQTAGVDLMSDGNYGDLVVRNIDVSGFYRGVYLSSWTAGAGLNNVLIEGVRAHHNTDGGIASWSQGKGHHNVTVRRCEADHNLGDPSKSNPSGSGIELAGVSQGLIENCVAHDNGGRGTNSAGPVGIWTYDSTRVTLQFNESFSNHALAQDGDGFDLDVDVTDSIAQYNYAHDNDGAGLLFCQNNYGGEWGNNVIRYNVSIDDARRRKMGALTWCESPDTVEQNSVAYGNTIYSSYGPVVLPTSNPRSANNLVFNNVFVAANGQPLVWSYDGTVHQSGGMHFRNNLYWASGGAVDLQGETSLEAWSQASGQEAASGAVIGTFADPLLEPYQSDCAAAAALSERVRLRISSLTSPTVDHGLDPASLSVDPGKRDFWGTALPQGAHFDLGARELPQ